MGRAIGVKEHQSMPDSITIVTGTTTGNFSAFMIPSSDSPTFTECIIDGVDLYARMGLFPEDAIIPCNLTSVTISAGSLILFS